MASSIFYSEKTLNLGIFLKHKRQLKTKGCTRSSLREFVAANWNGLSIARVFLRYLVRCLVRCFVRCFVRCLVGFAVNYSKN